MSTFHLASAASVFLMLHAWCSLFFPSLFSRGPHVRNTVEAYPWSSFVPRIDYVTPQPREFVAENRSFADSDIQLALHPHPLLPAFSGFFDTIAQNRTAMI
ncbi:hypothetical protein MRB53_008342 [Persea americana]|uniref:Uncharacterized protein n=1 Tax=Persea americana TaxID=3435 RepID=A0ACC2MLU3_PERAE|nr:hypothetical protein MRB53_008342 [Persea americana]